MGEISQAIQEFLLRSPAAKANPEQANRYWRLIEPFYRLVFGEARLAEADEVAKTAIMGRLPQLVGLPVGEPIAVKAIPWSRRHELPTGDMDYDVFFSTVFVAETSSAITNHGVEAYVDACDFFSDAAGDAVMRNVLRFQQGGLEDFHPEAAAAITRGLMSIGALGVLYAYFHDREGMSRLGPFVRFYAHVLPVGFRRGEKALSVLCGG